MYKAISRRDVIQRIGMILLFAIFPLFCCYILCWMNGIGLSEISLLGNAGNDEVIYYKMVEGIVHYGMPVGYFGYNESHAVVGTFSTWSPALLLFWGIWGKIFGWNLWSPMICNIVLLMLAMAVFAILTKPDFKQTAVILGMYFVCQFISDMALTTLPEVSCYFLIIIFAAISINLSRTDSYWKIKVIFLFASVMWLTWMRPYYCVLLILPSYELLRRCGKKIYGAIISGIVFLITIGIYVYINKNMCAPFLNPLLNFSWISLIIENPSSGIIALITKFLQTVRQFLTLIREGVLGIGGGAASAGFLGTLICYSYCLSKTAGEGIKLNKGTIRWGTLTAFCVLTFCANALIFGMGAMEKHFLEFVVLGIFVIGFECKIKISTKILLVFAWIFMVATASSPLKNASEELAIMEAGKVQLDNVITVNDHEENRWDSTIIWVLNDGEEIWWPGLYAVPAGMGINICTDDYVKEHYDVLQAKYLYTNGNGKITSLCEEGGAERIAYYGDHCVYMLR